MRKAKGKVKKYLNDYYFYEKSGALEDRMRYDLGYNDGYQSAYNAIRYGGGSCDVGYCKSIEEDVKFMKTYFWVRTVFAFCVGLSLGVILCCICR